MGSDSVALVPFYVDGLRVGRNDIERGGLVMTWMRTGTSTVLMALALMACASDLERPEGRATIAELIDKAAGRGSAGDAALDALAQLDEGSVPYLVGQLGDVRQLHGRRMTLTNKHHDAFEEFRTYSPDSIHDAVAAVLNQVTGESFVFVYNGATPAQRRKNRAQWLAWCVDRYPEQKAVCEGDDEGGFNGP